MYQLILRLLKIKPHETAVVKKLFAVQFLLGISTAFLFTSSLTTFISAYHINALPYVYIASALLLIVFNRIYSYLDERMTSPKLLEVVILFSITSVLFFWLGISFVPFNWVLLLLAGWYLVIYMLINYAFWGMASMLFNVRESRRLFSLVGAGDIPAKMIGYVSVTALVPFIGVKNLLLISVATGLLAWLLVNKYRKNSFLVAEDPSLLHHSPDSSISNAKNYINRFFGSRIVFFISIFSGLSYIIFAFIDFTFLAGVKVRFKEGGELASFFGIFFSLGRLMAVFFKLLFSSRLIAAIGLANSLLITPVVLLIITTCLLLVPGSFDSPFYVFGIMVLLSEMLRSTLQEPVFFILFQPLKPHDRLRGHLVAKGHTMPIALLGVGLFLFFYLGSYGKISIINVSQLLVLFMLLWCISVFLVKKEYLKTLTGLLRKGYFTGSTLFLNDDSVRGILLKKTEDGSALEKIHALNLLEKSGFGDRHKLLLNFLQKGDNQIRTYVLLRVIANNMTSALPLIRQQLNHDPHQQLAPQLYKALFFLQSGHANTMLQDLDNLSATNKKAALVGLLLRKKEQEDELVYHEIDKLSKSKNVQERLLALDIILESGSGGFSVLLANLLHDADEKVCKKAIETTGGVRNIELLEQMIEIVKNRRLYTSFKLALSYYGDDAFLEEYYKPEVLNEPLLLALISVAGKTTGEFSTALLISWLKNKRKYIDTIVTALWLKKAVISSNDKSLVEQCIIDKLENSSTKLSYYRALLIEKKLVLLQEAIQKEIMADLHALLRLYTFVFDADKLNRIIELITIGSASRIYNAIEMLELTLPAKYFVPTNHLIEWLQDVHANKVVVAKSTRSVFTVLEEIFITNNAGLHVWTRSIACYTVLQLKKDERLIRILKRSVFSKDDLMFLETRDYVLSTINT
ncbi:MAG: hypothetical protein WKF89_03635 [Chitinophagaceae bacterium]